MSELTPEQVREMLHNPIYTGMGPYPQIVGDGMWIKAAEKAVGEEGLGEFLRTMLSVLRRSMKGLNR